MHKKYLSIFLPISALILCSLFFVQFKNKPVGASISEAKNKQVSIDEAPPKPHVIAYSAFPDLNDLGANFNGSDPEQYYKAAIQVYYSDKDLAEYKKGNTPIVTNFDKSNFETDNEFKLRLARNIESNPSISFLSQYVVFTVHVDYPIYNAEKKQYEISLLSNQIIVSSYEPEETYIASNAFGASTRVKKRSGTYYKLEPTNTVPYDAFLPMAPAAAKQIQKNIAILYILKPDFPYVGTFYHHEDATFSKPREFTGMTYKIFGSVAAYAVYNKQTGEILLQKKL